MLNEVLCEIDKGVYSRPSSVTFEKFALDWLAGRRQIRGSTESGYGSIISRQLVPRLGSVPVTELRFEHVDAAVSGMIEDELSSKTIYNAVTLLRTILAGKKGSSALRRRVAFRDSTLGLELPPLHSRQITAPTPEQVWKLIRTAKEIGGLLSADVPWSIHRSSPKRSAGAPVRRHRVVCQRGEPPSRHLQAAPERWGP